MGKSVLTARKWTPPSPHNAANKWVSSDPPPPRASGRPKFVRVLMHDCCLAQYTRPNSPISVTTMFCRQNNNFTQQHQLDLATHRTHRNQELQDLPPHPLRLLLPVHQKR